MNLIKYLHCLTYNFFLCEGQHLSFPLVAVWVTVGLCACLLGLLVALACVCRKHLKQTCEEEQEEAGNYKRLWTGSQYSSAKGKIVVLNYMSVLNL